MRRELAVIIGITALVVALVLLLGPQLTRVETGAPKPADSIPLPPLKSERPTPEPDQPQDLQPLRVEVLDAVTGRHIERDTAVDLSLLDGTWLDVRRGKTDGLPLTFDSAPPGQPLALRLRRAGYVDTFVGPVVVAPETSQLIRAKMSPRYRVTIRPELPEYPTTHSIRIVPEGLPIWSDLESHGLRVPLEHGEAHVLLVPGKYHAAVTEPSQWPPPKREVAAWSVPGGLISETASRPGSPYDDPVLEPFSEFSFEVKDGPLVLTPSNARPGGKQQLLGSLVAANGDPLPRERVWAVRCGPGPLRILAGVATTDEHGRFRFDGLSPAVYHVLPDARVPHNGPDSLKLVDLRDGSPAEQVKLVASPAPEEERWGSARIRVLRQGRPVAGATIVEQGIGTLQSYSSTHPHTFASVTDADGWILLDELRHDEYVLSTIPYSMRWFELKVRKGRTTTAELELEPAGTGTLKSRVDIEESRCRSIRIMKDGLEWDPRGVFEVNGAVEYEICGVPAGASNVYVTDEDGFEYHYRVEIQSGESFELHRTERTANVTGSFPYTGFWREGSSLEFGDGVWSRREWNHSGPAERHWRDEFRLERVPRRRFPLLARGAPDGQVVAAALVDTSEGDARVENWVLLMTREEEAGATLLVDAPILPSLISRPEARLHIEGAGLPRIHIRTAPMTVADRAVSARFERLPAGRFTLRVEAFGFLAKEARFDLLPGETVRLQLQPDPSFLDPIEPEEPTSLPHRVELPPRITGKGTPPHPPAEAGVVPGSIELDGDWQRPASRTEWIYLEGAQTDELFATLAYGERSLSLAEEEYLRWGRHFHPTVRLAQAHGRAVLRVDGLTPATIALVLHVPGCEPVTVDLSEPARARLVGLKRR
ncbi:MAG: hypothetical protein ICCCNLDF_01959 [Planctomycetes bacterium]|nr:hypothetical protein [Planctomycetota bacterium]